MKNIKFKVLISQEKNNIFSKIEANSNEHLSYYFYLLKNGQVIDRCGWFESSKYSWKNLNPGRYQVRGFVKNIDEKEDRFSETVVIADPDIDHLWSSLSSAALCIPDLPFAPSSFPHQDILVGYGFNIVKNLKLQDFFHADFFNGNLRVLFNKPSDNKDIFFSGSSFFKDDLIFGQDDASVIFDRLSLLDSTGDFCAVVNDAERIIFSNDFFGIQKIYFFQDKEIFLASNRVHLLLLGIQALNIDCEIDPAMVKATLASGYVQPFQQIFSHNLLIKGVQLLSIDTRICINYNSVNFEPKPISDLLSNKVAPARSDEYELLIQKGVQDIIRQTNAVLNHPKFKNFVFDATGGMDSRVIVAAAAICDQERNKIVLNARDTPSIPLDIRVACQMASFLGFKHDALPENIEVYDEGYLKLQAISHLLGTYFAYDLNKITKEVPSRINTINVTGFFGEICLRPYYSRYYLERNESTSNKFYDFLLDENKSGLSNSDAKKYFSEIWVDSIKSLPGNTPVEKYDLHYLFYRNGLHCSDIFRFKSGTPRVGVIQSKNLFILKRKLYNRFSKTLLQNDVISRICPELLRIPYASNNDNQGFSEACLENESLKNLSINKIHVTCDGSDAVRARSSKTKFVIENKTSSCLGSLDLVKIAERAVIYLSESMGLIDLDFGKEILSNLRSEASPWILVNKVLMIFYIAKFSQKEYRHD